MCENKGVPGYGALLFSGSLQINSLAFQRCLNFQNPSINNGASSEFCKIGNILNVLKVEQFNSRKGVHSGDMENTYLLKKKSVGQALFYILIFTNKKNRRPSVNDCNHKIYRATLNIEEKRYFKLYYLIFFVHFSPFMTLFT